MDDDRDNRDDSEILFDIGQALFPDRGKFFPGKQKPGSTNKPNHVGPPSFLLKFDIPTNSSKRILIFVTDQILTTQVSNKILLENVFKMQSKHLLNLKNYEHIFLLGIEDLQRMSNMENPRPNYIKFTIQAKEDGKAEPFATVEGTVIKLPLEHEIYNLFITIFMALK